MTMAIAMAITMAIAMTMTIAMTITMAITMAISKSQQFYVQQFPSWRPVLCYLVGGWNSYSSRGV